MESEETFISNLSSKVSAEVSTSPTHTTHSSSSQKPKLAQVPRAQSILYNIISWTRKLKLLQRAMSTRKLIFKMLFQKSIQQARKISIITWIPLFLFNQIKWKKCNYIITQRLSSSQHLTSNVKVESTNCVNNLTALN